MVHQRANQEVYQKVHKKLYKEARHKHEQEINIDGTSKTSDQKDKKD
ncbi:hypothetical protein [Clostridium intestinale]|nr:hypothetical protein [Clostridium intestinale]